MLKDCCVIADNAVLPPETVVPPFTVMAGSPGMFMIFAFLTQFHFHVARKISNTQAFFYKNPFISNQNVKGRKT